MCQKRQRIPDYVLNFFFRFGQQAQLALVGTGASDALLQVPLLRCRSAPGLSLPVATAPFSIAFVYSSTLKYVGFLERRLQQRDQAAAACAA